MPIALSPARWREIESLLDDVLDQPESEQLSYLQRRCAGDVALFDDIKSLLASEQKAPSLLSTPAVQLVATLLSQETQTPPAQVLGSMLIGKRVGPYQLCEELGRGGMGVVYRAERRQGGFDQQVAIKLLPAVGQQSAIRERFAREQQTLAALSHQHIARLFDGGVTEDGQPYLVMEYVVGVPIDQYCDKHHLSIDHRLRLITQVMDALAYAHQHLIVHRDIKPSNVLVNHDGQVKLLDFGVAKMLGETNDLSLTRTGDQVLTPGYASPEQLKNKPVSVATDIYQLGLLMYEVLTGHCAYRDQADSVIALMKAVCERDPTLPSEIVQQPLRDFSLADDAPQRQHTPAQRANLRDADVGILQKTLRGDLDAILLRMLANDPEKRYRTIEALRLDLTAYWENRPISARPADWRYQTAKFMRRYWQVVTVSFVFVIVLMSYAITVTRQSQQIQRALDETSLQQRKSQQVSDFLVNIFKAADPNVAGLETLSAQALLEKGEQRIDQELENAPEIKGAMLTLLGEIYFSQGWSDKSAELMHKALSYQRKAGEKNRNATTETLTLLADVYVNLGQLDKAQPLYEESLALHQQFLQEQERTGSPEYAEALASYGDFVLAKGDAVRAEKLLGDAIKMFEQTAPSGHEELPNALNSLATLQHSRGQHRLAYDNFKKAIAIQERILGAEHSYFSVYLANLGITLTDMELYDEANDVINRALAIQKKILKPDHYYIASSLRAAGVLAYRRGDLLQAEKILREELSFHDANNNRHSLKAGMALMWLGSVLIDAGKLIDAEEVLSEMDRHFRNNNGSNETLGRGLCQRALLAAEQGDKQLAAGLFDQALALMPATGARTAIVQMNYASWLIDQQRYSDAEPFLRNVLHEREGKLPAEHSWLAEAQAGLAIVLNESGHSAEAQKLLDVAIPLLQKQSLYRYSLRSKLLKKAIAIQS